MPFWAQFPSGHDVLVPPGVQGAPPAPPGWGAAAAGREWDVSWHKGRGTSRLIGKAAWGLPAAPAAPPGLVRPVRALCWLGGLSRSLGCVWRLQASVSCGLLAGTLVASGSGLCASRTPLALSLSLSVNFKSHGTIVSRLESAQTSGAQLGEVTCSALQTGEGDVPPALGLRPSTPSNPRLTVLLTSNTQHLFAASQLPTFGITQVRRWTWPGARAPA